MIQTDDARQLADELEAECRDAYGPTVDAKDGMYAAEVIRDLAAEVARLKLYEAAANRADDDIIGWTIEAVGKDESLLIGRNGARKRVGFRVELEQEVARLRAELAKCPPHSWAVEEDALGGKKNGVSYGD